MTVVVLGYKSHSINDAPSVVYCGGSGVEAAEAAAASVGFTRIIKLVNPIGIPMPVPIPAEAPAVEAPEEPISKPSKKSKNL